ncbi:MAG: hypothetical protein AAB503_00830 [Patescibacteria group bacterium]
MFESRFVYLASLTAVLTVCFFFLQYSRVAEIWGINPNILLVFFLTLLFLRFAAFLFSVSALVFLIFSIFFFHFWFFEAIALVAVSIMAGFTRKALTGDRVLDFFTLVLCSTIIFYAVLYGLDIFSFSVLFIILKEALYNILVGCVALLFIFAPVFYDSTATKYRRGTR